MLFMTRLATYLNATDKSWRDKTILMIDNAPYHRNKETLKMCRDLKLPVLFLGPYQYNMAPVETVFRFIKARDLNP